MVVVPRQLPPAPAFFTNRAGEVAALDAVTAPDNMPARSPVLVVLTGTGGVGKTALAIWWAARVAGRFPDGQLYADLRGFAVDDAVAPADILGRYLRALGVRPARVPVELTERIALFRSVTAGLQLLIVVDNAVSAAQVRALLPASPGSVVVVTSRSRLAGLHGDGATFVEVTALSQRHAVELLTRSVGVERVASESDQIEVLGSLCAGLPIALCVVGARLASRPRWPISKVVVELTDERHRLENLSTATDISVNTAFDVSYLALTAEVARLYRLVSLHVGPELHPGVAGAACEISERAADNGLQILVDANLVEEIGPERYRFHDLVRLHARAWAERVGEDGDAVRRRIAEWYLRQVTRANMVAIPVRWRVSTVAQQYQQAPALFASQGEAIAWLDGQLPNLLAVLADCVARRWDELGWQLCEALWELFVYQRHYRDWIVSHQLGITAAERCGNLVAESRLRYQLGTAYRHLHRFDDAVHESTRARDLACRAGSRHNESVALQQLGVIAHLRGEHDAAIDYLQRSLSIEGELGIDRGVALRHQRIGEVLMDAGRDGEAAEHVRQALAFFARQADRRDEAQVLVSLARLVARGGETETALGHLDQAWQVLSTFGSPSFRTDVLLAYGEISQNNGDYVAARRYLTEALAAAREVDGPMAELIQGRLAILDAGLCSS